MDTITNRDRAENAAKILDFAAESDGNDLVDVLTNIMHYCNQGGEYTFAEALRIATDHYEAEIAAESQDSTPAA